VSDETPKQLIERRLREMAEEACDVVADSIRSKVVARGQQTRSADAWRVIDALLERTPDAESSGPNAEGVTPADDLAARRHALQQALRAKRADKQ